MGKLDGKVALVSGGSGGLGSAQARLFTEEGARVLIGDVRDELGQELARTLGSGALFIHLDVTDASSWEHAVQSAVDAFGAVDILSNTSGISRNNLLEDTTLEEYQAHVAVNQIGTFLGMKSVIGGMKSRGAGSIINFASTNGLRGAYGGTAYNATKFAVVGMTQCVAAEVGSFGVRVNAICPGGIDTEMTRVEAKRWYGLDVDAPSALSASEDGWQLPLRRLGQPDEIAKMALFLASDDSSYCTGAQFVVDGGLLADHPTAPGKLHQS